MKKKQMKILYEGSFLEMLKDDDYYGWKLSGELTNFNNITLDSCHLFHLDFSDYQNNTFSALDSEIEECDLSNLDLSRQSFYRTTFRKCKLVGTSFSFSTFRDCEFIDCVGHYLNFSQSKIKDTKIQNCDFSNSSFIHLSQNNLVFQNTNLDECDIMENDFGEVDISTCSINLTFFDQKTLKGLIISQDQALQIINILGVKVKGID